MILIGKILQICNLMMLSFCILILGVFYKLYGRSYLGTWYALKTNSGFHDILVSIQHVFATLEKVGFCPCKLFFCEISHRVFE
jgi:hypothetical protein